MKKLLALTLVAASITGAAACGGTEQDTDVSSAESVVDNPYGGLEVPSPTPSEPILKLVNRGNVISLSIDDLRKYPTVRVTVFEPFVKQNIEFVGVAMEELFRAVGIEPADTVLTVALNEYTYSNVAREFTGTQAVIAYEQSGGPILMSRGGPLRIIVPNNTSLAESLEVWNWSLAEIRVE